jgi:hypothetical protein
MAGEKSTKQRGSVGRRGHRFRWMVLRRLGNSLAAHATIAVPLIGYFILLNDQIIDFLKLHTSICNTHPCNVSWRLELLYIGGSLYGFAAAIYGLFCPTVIKKYAGGAEYTNSESDYFSNPQNLNHLLGEIDRMGGVVPDINPGNLRAVDSSYRKEQLGEVFAQHYIVLNYQNYIARLLCFIGFGTGIALAAIPTIWTFFQVMARVVERWL